MAHTGSASCSASRCWPIALGVAFGAAELFGVSFALGAFFAGMILSESQLSQQAAAETLPLRDAFAVLFFVSVGMLFDPTILVREPLPVLATVLIILVGKSLAALAIVRAFGYANATALTISACLAQIGEFSFILAGLGVRCCCCPRGRDLILAGAIICILLNPLLFSALDLLAGTREKAAAERRRRGRSRAADARADPADQPHRPCGAGRSWPGRQRDQRGLGERNVPLFVIEDNEDQLTELRARHRRDCRQRRRSRGDRGGQLPAARCLLVAIPDAFEGGQVVQQARAINPSLPIVARAHSEEEILSEEARRQSRGDGRARDRHGDAGKRRRDARWCGQAAAWRARRPRETGADR